MSTSHCWKIFALQCVCWEFSLAALFGAPPGNSASSATPVDNAKVMMTNQKSFFIPVSVDRARGGAAPVEVDLIVSTDRGANWNVYARQPVDTKGFAFKATADGEYWFCSRTVDAQGRLTPSGELQPELKIAIDGAPPRIDLDAAVGSAGEVKAAWRITDAGVDPQSVRVEFQSADAQQQPWQEVKIKDSEQKLAGELLTGAVQWSPQTNSRVIDVRILARDKAGNFQSEVRRVYVPRVAKTVPQIPEWPPVEKKTGATAKNAPRVDPFTARAASQPTAPLASGGGQPWQDTNQLPTTTVAKPSESPAIVGKEPLVAGPPALPRDPLARLESKVAPLVREGMTAQPSSTGSAQPLVFPTDDLSAPPADKSGFTPPRVPLEAQIVPPSRAMEARPIPNSPERSAITPLLSASRGFSLDYDLDSVGPGGVRSVELWVTTDEGNTWRKWGEDADRQSPFEIQVESERTFGFRMVIVANNGLATKSPEPGDQADIWVAVDVTKPSVKLLQAGYGQGEHAGQLDLRWQADDEHLGTRPVAILFGERPEGPFTTLAAGLPNTGQYYWTIDPRTPRQLYLRLEVRDEAGNTGIDQTHEPISLEGLAPRGRIKSIVPQTSSNQATPFSSPLFR